MIICKMRAVCFEVGFLETSHLDFHVTALAQHRSAVPMAAPDVSELEPEQSPEAVAAAVSAADIGEAQAEVDQFGVIN